MRLWLDTDIGGDPDDAIALVTAVRHPHAQLVGVSTVDADVERRARMARDLLDQLDVTDIPVHAGTIPNDGLAAVDALVAIGPLTNVAAAIERGAPLPSRIVAMGGALAPVVHRGEVHEREHNYATDPVAAQRAIRDCARLVVVPLDVTAALLITHDEEDALARTAAVVSDEIMLLRAAGVPVCLHDPLAVLTALDDAPVTRAARSLTIDGRGRVRVDGRQGTAHETVIGVDARAAIQRVLDTCTCRRG